MVRGRTISSLNIPVVRILVSVLHLFGAFFKTIHFGWYRKNEPTISHTKTQKCIVKHMCLTIIGIFANHRKRPKSLQNTMHRAIKQCRLEACFRHEVLKTIVNTMRKPYPDISIYTPRTCHARFKKP